MNTQDVSGFAEDVIEIIKRHEGFRAQPYQCPSSILTIGWGLNLHNGIPVDAAESIPVCHLVLDVLSSANRTGQLVLSEYSKRQKIFDMQLG